MNGYMEMIITGITNTDLQGQVSRILDMYGINSFIDEIDFEPFDMRIKENGTAMIRFNGYNDDKFPELTRVPCQEFINKFSILTYKQFVGSITKDYKGWIGKTTVNGVEVHYKSRDLPGLEHAFIAAVNETIEQHKLKNMEKQMNEVKYKVSEDSLTQCRGWYIYKNTAEETLYLYKDGSEHDHVVAQTQSDVFFKTKEEAIEFVNEFTGALKNIFDEDQLKDWRDAKIPQTIAEVIEFLMENKITFTRHDIIRGARELLGSGIEITYDDWKDTVIDYIENNRVHAFDYSKVFTDGRWEYVYIGMPLLRRTFPGLLAHNLVGVATDHVPTSDAATYEPKQMSIPVEAVRREGLNPGDTALVIAIKNRIYFARDERSLAISMVQDDITTSDILFQQAYKVDSSGNVRLSKNIFIAAGLEALWGQRIKWLTI